jgi:hypothetical protein
LSPKISRESVIESLQHWRKFYSHGAKSVGNG